jgi:hypothetical protein
MGVKGRTFAPAGSLAESHNSCSVTLVRSAPEAMDALTVTL